MKRKIMMIGFLCGSLFMLAGCQFMMSDLTKVDLRIVAGGDLNPDDNGRPSPLVVRLLELKSIAGFENAEFFSLYHHEKETLGGDLISSEELELKPGDVQDIKFALSPESKFIAVMGAYRQLDKVSWRMVLPLRLKSKNDLTVLFGSQGVATASGR
ncbi:type VI secretion system-associated lipoprotein [Gammaproteobacteria bacterium 45_16_T64]|nr:type VI secretion system-associated lipoprotein [Gammaproteobacteria bacterium 45_16_T64]